MTNVEGKLANCFACLLPWSSDPDQQPIYSCQSKDCENFFHKSCGDRLRPRISHPFHHHPLWLRVSKPRSCDSCCKKDCRLIYTCLQTTIACGFSLCTQCANYSTATVQCQSHDHPLCLVERSFCDDNIRCEACLKSYNHQIKDWVTFPDEVNKTRSLLFRCLRMECSSSNLHFLCGPLPVRVSYEYHIHPLNLVDSSTIKVNVDSDEYYCDACEERRDPQFRVYHCADCKYVAHIHCLLVQIMKVIKADTKHVELEALGENRWDKNLINNDRESTSTIGDIISSLTQEEKQRLRDPFFADSFSKKNLSNIFQIKKGIFDSFFDREKPTEDVARVGKFFNFGDRDFEEFNLELNSFIPEEGLSLDEKYLRQKVEDVQGYKVPKTVSPVLHTLLRKYGDLGEDSHLTPAMKSLCATLLCATIDRMFKTKVEDLTRDDLRHFYFYMNGIYNISDIDLERYVKTLDNFAEAFLGFEVTRFERDVGEKLEVRVKTLEADLKRYKGNLDKFKAYGSVEKSDFMKKCLNKASKCRGKYLGDEW